MSAHINNLNYNNCLDSLSNLEHALAQTNPPKESVNTALNQVKSTFEKITSNQLSSDQLYILSSRCSAMHGPLSSFEQKNTTAGVAGWASSFFYSTPPSNPLLGEIKTVEEVFFDKSDPLQTLTLEQKNELKKAYGDYFYPSLFFLTTNFPDIDIDCATIMQSTSIPPNSDQNTIEKALRETVNQSYPPPPGSAATSSSLKPPAGRILGAGVGAAAQTTAPIPSSAAASSSSSSSERANKTAALPQLPIIKVRGDGNCFFRSFSVGLYLNSLGEKKPNNTSMKGDNHKEYRDAACQYIQELLASQKPEDQDKKQEMQLALFGDISSFQTAELKKLNDDINGRKEFLKYLDPEQVSTANKEINNLQKKIKTLKSEIENITNTYDINSSNPYLKELAKDDFYVGNSAVLALAHQYNTPITIHYVDDLEGSADQTFNASGTNPRITVAYDGIHFNLIKKHIIL